MACALWKNCTALVDPSFNRGDTTSLTIGARFHANVANRFIAPVKQYRHRFLIIFGLHSLLCGIHCNTRNTLSQTDGNRTSARQTAVIHKYRPGRCPTHWVTSLRLAPNAWVTPDGVDTESAAVTSCIGVIPPRPVSIPRVHNSGGTTQQTSAAPPPGRSWGCTHRLRAPRPNSHSSPVHRQPARAGD